MALGVAKSGTLGMLETKPGDRPGNAALWVRFSIWSAVAA